MKYPMENFDISQQSTRQIIVNICLNVIGVFMSLSENSVYVGIGIFFFFMAILIMIVTIFSAPKSDSNKDETKILAQKQKSPDNSLVIVVGILFPTAIVAVFLLALGYFKYAGQGIGFVYAVFAPLLILIALITIIRLTKRNFN